MVVTRTFQERLARTHSGLGAGGRGGKVGRARRRPTFTLAALAGPSILLILLINLYPVIYAGVQAVHDGSLIHWGPMVGLDNFVDVLGSTSFWQAARFTVIFTLVGVFGSWIVGLALAVMLSRGVPGRGAFRVLLLLPWVIPVVSSAMAWNWLIATPDSPVPQFFESIGLGSLYFLADPTLAAITVCVFKVWVSFPFMMLMMSSALAGVDETVYEAGTMDGASRWQQLTHLTLPMIARPIYISWTLMTIFCVNDFTTVYLLTGGGPVGATNTLIVLAYRTVFQDMLTGPGVAIAFLMTITLTIVSVVLYTRIRKENHQ